MPDQPLRVEIVSHPGRKEVLAGLISLAVVAASIGAQWWAYTPEAERRKKLADLGLTRCREGEWHFKGVLLAWPPRRCLCAWPVESDPESQAKADRAESASLGQEK